MTAAPLPLLLLLPPEGYSAEQAAALEVPAEPPPALVEALAAIVRRLAVEELQSDCESQLPGG